MLKTAIVGCGAISKVHANAVKELDNAVITAFCDSDIYKAMKKTNEYGGKFYGDLNEMLDKEQIDVLHICTPHYLHVPMAKLALERNINVIMEKPPAMNMDEFYDLKRQADASSKLLGVCFQNRYNDTTKKALELINSAKAGRILGARAFVTWSRFGEYYTDSEWRGKKDKEGGSVLINQSIHTLDLLTYFLGKPTSVKAQTANNHLEGVIDTEDTVNAYITFENGATALFYATTAYCKSSPIVVEIATENLTVKIEGTTVSYVDNEGNTETFDYPNPIISGKKCWGASHNRFIADFYNAVSNGDKNFANTLDSTETTFKLMCDIYKSAEGNK